MRRQAPVAAIGRSVLAAVAALGRVTLFALSGLRHAVTPPIYGGEIVRAGLQIGWLSLPVVGLTALFTGAALALQIYSGGSRFNAEAAVPSIVAIGMVRELGPVLGGLMVAGRAASAIAAEIATMKVTEQIDALVTLSTDPMKYLVAPRLVMATLSLPVLVAVGDAIGVLGGYLVGTAQLGFAPNAYLRTTVDFLEPWDIGSGLVKGAAFGFIVALMGCYHGMQAGRGARGVGRATTNAVVSASVLILAANYALTDIFFSA